MPATFNSKEIDAIGEIMNISLGASATAVSTMLSAPVNITTPVVKVLTRGNFEFKEIEPAIGVSIAYTEGLSGKNIMLFSRNDVRIIVGMMMGMEIPEDQFEMDEMNKSAICEVMNQMMGSSATALSEFLGYPVNISTPECFEIKNEKDFKEQYFADNTEYIVVRFTLEVSDKIESEFLNVMSADLAKKMLEPFSDSLNQEGDAESSDAGAAGSADAAGAGDAGSAAAGSAPDAGQQATAPSAPAGNGSGAEGVTEVPKPELTGGPEGMDNGPVSAEDAKKAEDILKSSSQRSLSQSEMDALMKSMRETNGDAAAPAAAGENSTASSAAGAEPAQSAPAAGPQSQPASAGGSTPQGSAQNAAPVSGEAQAVPAGNYSAPQNPQNTNAAASAPGQPAGGMNAAPSGYAAPQQASQQGYAPNGYGAPQPVPQQGYAPNGYAGQPVYVQQPAGMDPAVAQLLASMQQSQQQMVELIKDIKDDENKRDAEAKAMAEARADAKNKAAEAKKEKRDPALIHSMTPQTFAEDDEDQAEDPNNREMLLKVPVEISVEIGRTRKPIKDILELTQGSLVVLDKMAGEQADLYVNGECIARGDIVVVEDNFGIRITEIVNKDIYQEKMP